MRTMISRRELLASALVVSAGRCASWAAPLPQAGASAIDGTRVRAAALKFIASCARDDGGYAPSPDPKYSGDSDTAASDLAAVTYAATLAKTLGWKLPHAARSVDFIQRHQQANGVFVNFQGKFDPKADLAVLYNTTQGAVSLRALGAKPKFDCAHVMERFFPNDAFKQLPWYTLSFYPLFYAALGKPFPSAYRDAIARHIAQNQAADGYLGDHVAATFHMVHFFRLIGQPTPRADAVVKRVLRDQQPDGGWHLKPHDWDVHSCFDAVFILRQLSWDSPASRAAVRRAATWALSCQTPDGGFSHYPHEHADMDAVYFQLGTLIQAEEIPGANYELPDAETLSWGHAMKPGKDYQRMEQG